MTSRRVRSTKADCRSTSTASWDPRTTASDERWFVFLETLDSAHASTVYEIHGVPFVLDGDGVRWDATEIGLHRGLYRRQDPAEIAWDATLPARGSR